MTWCGDVLVFINVMTRESHVDHLRKFDKINNHHLPFPQTLIVKLSLATYLI